MTAGIFVNRRGCFPGEELWTRAKALVQAALLGPGGKKSSPKGEVLSFGAASGGRDRNETCGRLLDQYGNAVLRLAYSYLRNQQDAEDVLQDTLLQYLKKSPQLESPEHEKAWLLRVAINLCKNRLRYRHSHSHLPLDETLVSEEESDLKFIWDAVQSLPEKYREVVHLFYEEGYSTAQIASLLGKKEATVRSLLHRARGILREKLKGAYDFEVS